MTNCIENYEKIIDRIRTLNTERGREGEATAPALCNLFKFSLVYSRLKHDTQQCRKR